MSASFEDILAQVKEIPTKKLSVAAAQDLPVMEAVFEAKERGIAEPILVGDEPRSVRLPDRSAGIWTGTASASSMSRMWIRQH